MANSSQMAQSNPFELTHVLNFDLRLLPHETIVKLREADQPPRKQVEEPNEDEIISEPEPTEEKIPSKEEAEPSKPQDAASNKPS